MVNLNKDVLFLILEELQDDRNSLCSCLLVNKSWCEIIVPILWKNPWKYLKEDKKISWFNVIITHLSNETRENLRNQDINLLSNVYQKPLFNYIGFCRYLDLSGLEEMFFFIGKFKMPIESDEILELFINRNTKFTHLSIPRYFNYNCEIHLIPGAEHCFSDLKFLQCISDDDGQEIFEGLARISKSIKELKLDTPSYNNNSGIIKLIESQKNLSDVHFVNSFCKDMSFCKTFETSLIKHANTVQCLNMTWMPFTKVLSCLVNLVSLCLNMIDMRDYSVEYWNQLENVSLPALKILKTANIHPKILANFITNTKRGLTEISIYSTHLDDDDNKRLIQAIYLNCPNLKYLRLLIKNSNISEFENLLINCQHLSGLVIIGNKELVWDNLFETLTKSSPINLFKFKFHFSFNSLPILGLKLFFEDWKGRHPILLHIPMLSQITDIEYLDLINKYRAEGIIKNYDNNYYGNIIEGFEW